MNIFSLKREILLQPNNNILIDQLDKISRSFNSEGDYRAYELIEYLLTCLDTLEDDEIIWYLKYLKSGRSYAEEYFIVLFIFFVRSNNIQAASLAFDKLKKTSKKIPYILLCKNLLLKSFGDQHSIEYIVETADIALRLIQKNFINELALGWTKDQLQMNIDSSKKYLTSKPRQKN